MGVEEKYQERYKAKNTPWDIGKPDFNLVEVVYPASRGKVQGA